MIALERLAPVDLADLPVEAALMSRVDRKYALTREEAHRVLDRLGPGTRVVTVGGRTRLRYASTYLDTPELLSFRLAAHGRRRRFKVRTRCYLDSAACFLEVKTRGPRGTTRKERTAYDGVSTSSTGGGLDEVGLSHVETVLAGAHGAPGAVGPALQPVLRTTYARTTLLPDEPGVRVTVDDDLVWADHGTTRRRPGLVVLETKTGARASSVDRLLWSQGHRPDTISKYGTGLAALRPDLPANRWARVLREHF